VDTHPHKHKKDNNANQLEATINSRLLVLFAFHSVYALSTQTNGQPARGTRRPPITCAHTHFDRTQRRTCNEDNLQPVTAVGP